MGAELKNSAPAFGPAWPCVPGPVYNQGPGPVARARPVRRRANLGLLRRARRPVSIEDKRLEALEKSPPQGVAGPPGIPDGPNAAAPATPRPRWAAGVGAHWPRPRVPTSGLER